MTAGVYRIELTGPAEADLAAIVDYIEESDSPAAARTVGCGILAAVRELSTLPLRGAPVREVADIHPQGFRQVFFHSYRVIYAVIGPNVVVLAMADGRRELTELLRRHVAGRSGVSGS